jgi:glyoxylase-like metal-dependent hydrolase (beta-lactamase superfamily II)
MRVLLIALCGVLVCAAQDRPQPDPGMLQADRAFVEAAAKADKPALGKLLDADFTWTDAQGNTRTKADILRDTPKAAIANENDAQLKQYGYGEIGDVQANLGTTHVLRVWAKRGGSWKAMVYQEVMSRDAPPSVAPGAGKDCENPCKTVAYQPKNATERQVVAAYTKLETAAMARDSAVFATVVADEFVAASANSDKLYDKRGRMEDFDHSKMGGLVPAPLVSARMFDFGEAVLMTSEHQPERGKPLHITRLWVRRDGSWVETLSYQTSVAGAAAVAGAAIAAALVQQPLAAQMRQPLLTEDTVKISDHVWAIMGFPNVAIIVGDRATLVVDTGLGPRNGATVARAAAKLSQSSKLFLTTTHYHPEHAGGEPGFPAGTILIRNTVQQREMEQHGVEILDRFRKMSAQNAELLKDVTSLRTPDILFQDEAKLDLGGVTVRLLWLGEGHTKGDELTFVEPDGTLVSGDIVQNKVVPGIADNGGTSSSWIAVLDKLAALNVRHVLPDHSAPGDGSLITAERNFLSDVQARAQALKQQGISAEDAGKQLSVDLKAKYADWPSMNAAGLVQRIYTEGQ